MSNHDDEFEDIAEDTIRRASEVDCEASVYRAGLRQIIGALQTEIQAWEECER